jgi:hypothetical protein
LRDVMNAIGIQIMTMAFVGALAVAALVPAPARNKDALLLPLLGTVLLAVVVMGVLALQDVLIGTAILAAIGASIMVPCAWLARAPGPDFADADAGEDEDGGGSPPYQPSPQDGPDDRRPTPTRAPALSFAMSLQAAASPPALAPAGPRAGLPPPVAVPPPADLPPEPARDPEPRRPRLRRGDHRSIAHRRGAGQHAGRRRRGVMRIRLLHGWRRLACVSDAEPTTPVDAPR